MQNNCANKVHFIFWVPEFGRPCQYTDMKILLDTSLTWHEMLTVFNGYSYFVYNRNISKNTPELKLKFSLIFLESSNDCNSLPAHLQTQLFYYFLFNFQQAFQQYIVLIFLRKIFFPCEDPFRSVKCPIAGTSRWVWVVFDF